jgi:hypothetical protein
MKGIVYGVYERDFWCSGGAWDWIFPLGREATAIYIHKLLSLFTKQAVLKTTQILKRECTRLDVIKRL